MSDADKETKVAADEAGTEQETSSKKGKGRGGKKKKETAESGDGAEAESKSEGGEGDEAKPKAKAKGKAKGKRKASSKKKGSKKGSQKGGEGAAAGAGEEKKEKKERKPRAKRAPSPVRKTAASDRAPREKKQTEAFQFAVDSTPKVAADVQPGKGTPLGEIENIETNLKKLKATDSVIVKLYGLLFPGAARNKLQTKKVLRQFSGYSGDDTKAQREAVETKLAAYDPQNLKKLASVLDLDSDGSEEAVAARIAAFLDKPKSSGKEYSGIVRGAVKRGSKRKSSGKLTGYIKYSTENRKAMVKKHPKATPQEIMSKLAAAWRALSQKEKDSYGTSKGSKRSTKGSKKSTKGSKKSSTKKPAKKKAKKSTSKKSTKGSKKGTKKSTKGKKKSTKGKK